eukprot:TRINITY_DN16542_c0_g1_i2.p1 TRINITY_DN16542_c0_g1~~TRINITY_DN16542_c0_g1_i2.p1  ORF type:complete len:328 (+),score=45.31 TRINITY_DN16542_c0_g1_i2:187-1170(+)
MGLQHQHRVGGGRGAVVVRCTVQNDSPMALAGPWWYMLRVSQCGKVHTYTMPIEGSFQQGERQTWDCNLNIGSPCTLHAACYLGHTFPPSASPRDGVSFSGGSVSILLAESDIDILDMMRPVSSDVHVAPIHTGEAGPSPLHAAFHHLERRRVQGGNEMDDSSAYVPAQFELAVGLVWGSNPPTDPGASMLACNHTLLAALLSASTRGTFQARLLQAPMRAMGLSPFETSVTLSLNASSSISCTAPRLNLSMRAALLRRLRALKSMAKEGPEGEAWCQTLEERSSELLSALQGVHQLLFQLQDSIRPQSHSRSSMYNVLDMILIIIN